MTIGAGTTHADELLVGVADHVYLMQGGKVVLSQPAAEVSLDHPHKLYVAR